MMFFVFGSRDGVVLSRYVSTAEFEKAWGPWAAMIFNARWDSPLAVGTLKVWVEVPA